jgi:hypothetical protein
MLKWWASAKVLFAAMGNGRDREAGACRYRRPRGNLVTPTGLVPLRLIATVIGALVK